MPRIAVTVGDGIGRIGSGQGIAVVVEVL